MRFAEVFRYELGHRLRSPSTWLYGALLFLLAFWVVHVDNTGGHTLVTNGPFRLAETTALFCGLFGMVATAGLVADAALRDRAARMEPLLFTTRLRPAELLGGRFAATLLVHAGLVLATPLGLWLGTLMPYLDPRGFGPQRAAAYLQPILLFTLPNLVLVGAILFAIAVWSRQAIPVYLGTIAIFVAYIAAANSWSSISHPLLAALADPLGINALKAMTRYWTAAERNTRMIGFPAMLLWNRLLWLGIAAGILALVQRTFRFTERDRRRRVEVDAPHEAAPATAPTSPRSRAARVAGGFGARSRRRQILAVARESGAQVVSGRAFQVAFVGAIGLVVLWGWNVGDTVFDTATWPVTHLVAGVVIAQRSILVPWLLIVIWAGELVWKERDSGTAEIADAVPVRTGSVVLGRFLALVALVAIFQLAFLVGGVLLQALQGWHRFEPGLYLQILFGLKLADFVILGTLAMTVHVLVDHKYAGHLLALVCLVLLQAASSHWHHLLVYGSGPAWTYSEMNGFGPFAAPLVAFRVYWAAWALLLGVVMLLFWPRGLPQGISGRLATARARLAGPAGRLAAVAAVLVAAIGGFLLYETTVRNESLSPERSRALQAETEGRYGRYRDLPQPVITRADLRIELYPERPAAEMSGTYRLENRTAMSIRDVHVATPRSVGGYEVRALAFDRPARATVVDPDHGYRIFALERPLAPGESLHLRFDVALRPRGIAHEPQTSLVRNGTYLDRRWLPFIGYQPFVEIADASERAEQGLPPRAGMPEPGDPAAGKTWSLQRDGDRLQVETTVGTSGDQIPVVPGVLRRSWTANGRRYAQYGNRVPETFGTAVFSARYAVREGRWNDVALEVYHHPPHGADVDRMLAAMRSALACYTAWFGPYPYRELRVVEIPPYSVNARAFPSALALAEQNFLTRTAPGLVDLTFFGTAHETAHQWWGGQVRPAYAKGRSFVSESLANYSAMMVTESVLGPAEARRVYDYQMDRYLTRRGETGRDAPLLAVEDQAHVSYGKGAVALHTLRERIGAEAVNGALRRFLARYRGGGPPYPTSLDLYAELRAATPPALHGLLVDLFETITLWDLESDGATSRPLGDGRSEVTWKLHARKVRADGVGRESETPMDDVVEVAAFGAASDTPIWRDRIRLRGGEQTVKIVVPGEPVRVALDPERKLIERQRGDNAVDVTAAP